MDPVLDSSPCCQVPLESILELFHVGWIIISDVHDTVQMAKSRQHYRARDIGLTTQQLSHIQYLQRWISLKNKLSRIFKFMCN